MKDRDEITCKPFKKHHDEQLKLVSSFDWIDFSYLSDIREIISGVLLDEQAADYMEKRRVRTICDLAEQRVRNLEALARSGAAQTITAEDDVKENIAADYKDQSIRAGGFPFDVTLVNPNAVTRVALEEAARMENGSLIPILSIAEQRPAPAVIPAMITETTMTKTATETAMSADTCCPVSALPSRRICISLCLLTAR